MNLVWFRSDLRVDDNPALFRACEDTNEAIVAIYFNCPEQDALHGVGINHQNLRFSALKNLKRRLSLLNVDLLIVESANYSILVDDLTEICHKLNVKNLFFNDEYAVNERKRDNKIRKNLLGLTSVFHFNGDSIIAPKALLNKVGLPYKVFTPYAKAVRILLEHSPLFCYCTPEKMPRENFNILRTKNYITRKAVAANYLDKINNAAVSMPNIDEVNLRDRLSDFAVNNIGAYEQERNFLNLESTSKLSFGLAVGAISVRRCYQTASDMAASDSVSWANELIWRDFYRSVMWHFPHVSKNQAFKSVDKNIEWSQNLIQLEQWKIGETGVPIIDAAMKQLLSTGWMHNRLRMITACYLSKNLWLDWRLGEAFFAKHLFDYDFSSNNGGWQWCASVGTDAAPYFRIFNPANQQKKFDPEATFIKKWLPQLSPFSAKEIHNFESKPLPDYPCLQTDLKLTRKLAIESFKRAMP